MRILWLIWLCIGASFANAHEAHTKHQKTTLAMSVAFDSAGVLWRASVQDGFVVVDNSNDLGKHFSAPIQLNTRAQKIGADGEARPKIAAGPDGRIYVTWTEMLAKPYSGYIWFARSAPEGKGFEKPYIVHQDRAEITHRFDALTVAPNGTITVAWVDKRDLLAAKAAGKPYEGAAIYYAVSTDAGASFAPEQKLADSSCECCRIAMTSKADGTAVAMWRHVFAGSERDHAIAELITPKASTQKTLIQKPPTLVRASFGRWQIDGCPHHGAALALGQGFGYHMAYFDGAGAKPSLMVARMDGEAWVSSPPKRFGNMAQNAGHPALASVGETVWLVWQEIVAGKTTEIHGMQSDDGGRSWSSARLLMSVPDKADYPQLLVQQQQVYLAVNTLKQGVKLLVLAQQVQ